MKLVVCAPHIHVFKFSILASRSRIHPEGSGIEVKGKAKKTSGILGAQKALNDMKYVKLTVKNQVKTEKPYEKKLLLWTQK